MEGYKVTGPEPLFGIDRRNLVPFMSNTKKQNPIKKHTDRRGDGGFGMSRMDP